MINRDETAVRIAGDILRGPGTDYSMPDHTDAEEVADNAMQVAVYAYAITDALIALSKQRPAAG